MEGITKTKVVAFVGQLVLIVAGVWVGNWLYAQSFKPRTSPPASTPAPTA